MAEVARKPISLLEELQAASGFEAGLLTTFNAYLPFLEEVVLRRLRASGCHYVVVLMDRDQLSSELIDRARRPLAAGSTYGLLPIPCGGAFHPKIAILVGPKNARVIVGSHNLTMSGFIQNREVTNIIDVAGPRDRAGAAVVIEALEFSRAWASSLPSPLQLAVEDFSKLCRQYLGPVPEAAEISVVGSRPDGASLWQRVRRLLPETAKRIAILGPFFDKDLSFVRRVNEDLRPQGLLMGIDPETGCFPGDTKNWPRGSRVVDAHDLSPGHKGRGYLHAKAMLIESKSERILITGSANPTAAAWLAPARSRNAEIVVIRRLPPRAADDLGLGELWKERAIAPGVLAKLRSRPEQPKIHGDGHGPLVGVCQGAKIHIEGTFRSVGPIVVRDPHGVELASSSRKSPAEVVVDVTERPHEAAAIEAMLDGNLRHGFVHHVDLLREAAVSSSQRRVREALSGLNGDPSELEELLRLVEKVIFDASPVETGVGRKRKTARNSKDPDAGESTVALVSTLKKDLTEERRHLSTGDLGLLLDYLMRKLWQGLAHDPSSGIRPEAELIDSDDEDLLQQLPTDREIAEAWHRKSRTLLRRLSRRVHEGSDALQIVVETAAVLGVLEAVRRVENQDRWRSLRAHFVDREEGTEFVFDAVPLLLKPATGLLDLSTKKAGAPFSEQQALIEWTTWMAWLTGFGPSDIWVDEEQDESDAAIESADRLARACLVGVRAAHADRARIIDLLEASPFPGTDPRAWLDSLVRLGTIYAEPAKAPVLKRPAASGDLVVMHNGSGPYVVRCVRGHKVDLIDFDRPEESATVTVHAHTGERGGIGMKKAAGQFSSVVP